MIMNKKTPDWQDNDKDILSQFPNSPAPELMALRQEPDWALKAQILSIPEEELGAEKRHQWTFGGGLFNRLAGAAVLGLLVVILGLWIFSISTNNVPPTTQPESAAPVSTIRPTENATRDMSSLLPSNIVTATPTETSGCPVTPFLQGDPDVDELGMGSYFINENRTIWANRPRSWQTGGEKVLWRIPVGSELTINGRLLGSENSVDLEVTEVNSLCCYAGNIQITSLYFHIPGCWEVTAQAGEEQLQFVTEVVESGGMVLTGLTLLDYNLSNTNLTSGEFLTVTLNWQSGGADAEDMVIFFHQLDAEGSLVGQLDEVISSDIWISQNISTTHSFPITNEAATIMVGLYNGETLARVPFYFNDEIAFTGVVALPEKLTVVTE
jgi:hypothetical protein